MHASVRWLDNLRFEGYGQGQATVPLQCGEVDRQDRKGVSSLELILIGLVSCTAADVISILHKMRERVTGLEVRVEADRAESHPRVFTSFSLVYSVTGHQISPEAVQRAIDLSAEKYCPSIAMLSQVAPLEHTFEIHPANGT
jgi:putative redox protein